MTMSLSQQQELWLGPLGDNGSVFRSDEHRREVWFRYRDKIMELWGRHGKRPYAWWRYEGSEWGLPSRHPGVHEQSILYEFSNALSADERAELEARWRKEFERSWRPNFSYCKEGRVFTGDIARELHWLWADIPPPLVDRWMEERERRGRTIRELQEESQQGEAAAGSPPAA